MPSLVSKARLLSTLTVSQLACERRTFFREKNNTFALLFPTLKQRKNKGGKNQLQLLSRFGALGRSSFGKKARFFFFCHVGKGEKNQAFIVPKRLESDIHGGPSFSISAAATFFLHSNLQRKKKREGASSSLSGFFWPDQGCRC